MNLEARQTDSDLIKNHLFGKLINPCGLQTTTDPLPPQSSKQSTSNQYTFQELIQRTLPQFLVQPNTNENKTRISDKPPMIMSLRIPSHCPFERISGPDTPFAFTPNILSVFHVCARSPRGEQSKAIISFLLHSCTRAK